MPVPFLPSKYFISILQEEALISKQETNKLVIILFPSMYSAPVRDSKLGPLLRPTQHSRRLIPSTHAPPKPTSIYRTSFSYWVLAHFTPADHTHFKLGPLSPDLARQLKSFNFEFRCTVAPLSFEPAKPTPGRDIALPWLSV